MEVSMKLQHFHSKVHTVNSINGQHKEKHAATQQEAKEKPNSLSSQSRARRIVTQNIGRTNRTSRSLVIMCMSGTMMLLLVMMRMTLLSEDWAD